MERSWKRLKSLATKLRAAVVAVLEPFQEEEKMPQLAVFLGFLKFCCKESSNGKVWIFWKDDYDFDVLHMIYQSLSGWFHLGPNQILVTFVYAECT